jgi:hypothetical protein
MTMFLVPDGCPTGSKTPPNVHPTKMPNNNGAPMPLLGNPTNGS